MVNVLANWLQDQPEIKCVTTGTSEGFPGLGILPMTHFHVYFHDWRQLGDSFYSRLEQKRSELGLLTPEAVVHINLNDSPAG